MSPAAIALCILVPLFLFALVFVAWLYPNKHQTQPYRRELSDTEMREGLAALDEMGIRFGDPEEIKAKDRGSFK